MATRKQIKSDTLSWLLEEDSPGMRYLALRDLVRLRPSHPDLSAARRKAHQSGPIAAILANMDASGYWVKAGAGYNPKYSSTVWSVIMLAQLGARVEEDERIARACAYVLDHTLAPAGQFSTSGAPSSTVDCLHGNLCWALLELGCHDPRLDKAYEWMARSVTGEGIAPATERQAAVRYYAIKSGPLFSCGANNKLSCAWGAVKVLLALAKSPVKYRTPLMKEALAQGAEFLLRTDPATANYPTGYSKKPSPNWWKFGFPVFYVTDLLQNVEALAAAGYGHDPRLANAIDLIRQKQTPEGRWILEYSYAGKTWIDYGDLRQPNKWVTLRALRALKACG